MGVSDRGSIRARRGVGGLVVALLVAGTAVVAVATSAGAAGETVVVSPADELVDGSRVLVEGTGWASGTVHIGQCTADPGSISDCELNGSVSTVVDSAGAFRTLFTVGSTTTPGLGPVVDCTAAPGACAIGVIQFSTGATASRSISFAAAPTPGAIAGTLATANLDGSAARACVTVSGTDKATAVSSGSGAYQVTGLRPGAYSVTFGACGVGPNWAFRTYEAVDGVYLGGHEAAVADLVVVRAGQTTSGIDDTLSIGGTIRGRVTDMDGSPLRDICVFTPLAAPESGDVRHAGG